MPAAPGVSAALDPAAPGLAAVLDLCVALDPEAASDPWTGHYRTRQIAESPERGGRWLDLWYQLRELLGHSFLNVSLGRVALAVGAIMVSLLLRQVFATYLSRLLRRHAARIGPTLDERAVRVVVRPARFLIVVAGIWTAASVLSLPPEARALVSRLVRSLVAGSVVWGLYLGADLAAGFVEQSVQRTDTEVDDLAAQFVRKSIKVIVVALGSVVVVQEWGYDVGGLLAGLGLGGLALALAAQDSAANLLGGIAIMLDRPFSIGDWIETPHVEGMVEEIGLRSTRVRTFANALVTVPNVMMGKDQITNWSRMRKRRVMYRLKVTYATSPDQLDECCRRIREMLSAHSGVHPEVIYVYFESFGESGPEILLYYFTSATARKEYLEVLHDTNLRVMRILDEMGIEVALPSRTVYLENGRSSPSYELAPEDRESTVEG